MNFCFEKRFSASELIKILQRVYGRRQGQISVIRKHLSIDSDRKKLSLEYTRIHYHKEMK